MAPLDLKLLHELSDIKGMWARGWFLPVGWKIKCYGEWAPHYNVVGQKSATCAELETCKCPCGFFSLSLGLWILGGVFRGSQKPMGMWTWPEFQEVRTCRFHLWKIAFWNPNQLQIVTWGQTKYLDFGLNSAGHTHSCLRLAARSTGRQKY